MDRRTLLTSPIQSLDRQLTQRVERNLSSESPRVSAPLVAYSRIRATAYNRFTRLRPEGVSRRRWGWRNAVACCVESGDTVIDGGANVGATTFSAALAVGDAGHVHSIEPAPEVRRVLEQRIAAMRLTNVTIHANAIGSGPGTAPFFVYDEARGGSSSLRERSDLDRVEGLSVDVTSLDEIASSSQIEALSLVKLDIEGAEVQALVGAAKLLEQFKPSLCLEVYQRQLLEFGDSVERLAELLRDHGYRIFGHVSQRVGAIPDLVDHAATCSRFDVIALHPDRIHQSRIGAHLTS